MPFLVLDTAGACHPRIGTRVSAWSRASRVAKVRGDCVWCTTKVILLYFPTTQLDPVGYLVHRWRIISVTFHGSLSLPCVIWEPQGFAIQKAHGKAWNVRCEQLPPRRLLAQGQALIRRQSAPQSPQACSALINVLSVSPRHPQPVPPLLGLCRVGAPSTPQP